MTLFIDFLWLIGGLVALYYGAEWLVGGSVRLAIRYRISPLVIGLTVVAFGTSAPELFVCIKFNLEGLSDMAIGNVVGSNICNIGLILGVSAFLYGLQVKRKIIHRDMPFLFAATGVFIWLIWDGEVSRWEGLVLAIGIVVYTFYSFWVSRQVKDEFIVEEFESEFGDTGTQENVFKQIGLILVGLVALYLGAEMLKKGGVSIAESLGVPPAVISLTLIAFATSVPELATSIVAANKKEGDIIIGNVVGSCIFNLLCVTGFTALTKPMAITEISRVDLGVMVFFTIIVFPMMRYRRDINRGEGSLLLLFYAGYVAWLYFTQVAV